MKGNEMPIQSEKEFEYHLFIVALDVFLQSTLDDESKMRLIVQERARLTERLNRIEEYKADLFKVEDAVEATV